MAQRKEQMKIPEKELNKMEIGNQSDAEFITLVIRMLKELSEDLKSIKNIQSEMVSPPSPFHSVLLINCLSLQLCSISILL